MGRERKQIGILTKYNRLWVENSWSCIQGKWRFIIRFYFCKCLKFSVTQSLKSESRVEGKIETLRILREKVKQKLQGRDYKLHGRLGEGDI